MLRVELLRRQQNVKQQELARKLGVNAASLNKLERGWSHPDRISQRFREALEHHFGENIHALTQQV
jgi:DNA-binding transcriptional regulator YiaG